MTQTWIDRFPILARLPEDLSRLLQQGSRMVDVPAGARVFAPGQTAENFLLLLEGTVRVQQTSESGREVVLYRVNAGESCILTTAYMLAHENYGAEGVAETQVRAVAIPRGVFDELAARSADFREFMFAAYSRRITDLFTLIDDIVFQKMDVRLAGRLLELADGDVVHATHQALATELGTAREVVSRMLGEFQRRGWVSSARGEVRITDRDALVRLAQSGS